MRYAVIYDSPSGNKKRMADEIKEYMDEQKGSQEECIFFGEPETDDRKTERISGAEIVFAGFWTDKGDCSEKMKGFLESLHGRKVFLFGTAGFGGSRKEFIRVLE